MLDLWSEAMYDDDPGDGEMAGGVECFSWVLCHRFICVYMYRFCLKGVMKSITISNPLSFAGNVAWG